MILPRQLVGGLAGLGLGFGYVGDGRVAVEWVAVVQDGERAFGRAGLLAVAWSCGAMHALSRERKVTMGVCCEVCMCVRPARV